MTFKSSLLKVLPRRKHKFAGRVEKPLLETNQYNSEYEIHNRHVHVGLWHQASPVMRQNPGC